MLALFNGGILPAILGYGCIATLAIGMLVFAYLSATKGK